MRVRVPWDIYLPTPQAARYYGNATQYADLFAFIRGHAELLDNTNLTVKVKPPSEGGYIHTHSGASGDKLRWRFPFPYTSPDWAPHHPHIGGDKTAVLSLSACEALCDHDSKCKGVWYSSGTCYTLHSLVSCDTTLAGDSYTRSSNVTNQLAIGPPPPPPLVVCSEPEVRVLVRQADPSSGSVLAIHLVDWRRSATWSTGVVSNVSYPPVSLNISNDAFNSSGAACGNLNLTLHQLDGTSKAVKPTCDQHAGVTIMQTESPEPWAIVEVRPLSTTSVLQH